MSSREKLMELCNDEAAVDFIIQLWAFSDVWDDIVDRDTVLSDDTLNTSIMWGLFGLHDSQFYRKYESALRPAIMLSIASWMVANKFERTGDPVKLEQAYFMRCARFDVFALVVLLVAGFTKHVEAIEYFRTAAPEDSLDKYKVEHAHGLLQP